MGRNPTHQIIAATYSFDRASDTGRKIKNQLLDPIHPKIFPGCSISTDSKSSNKLSTTQGGNVFSLGTGSGAIGRGANLFLIDDPISSRADAESETMRNRLVEWYRGVAYTRLMKDNRICIVQTRWHHYDLTGFLLDETKHERWVVLSFPALAGESDPLGRRNGEALWESHYPKNRLLEIRETIGLREWSSQYQQEPMVTEGAIVNVDDFQNYPSFEWKKYEFERNAGAHVRPPFGIRQIVCSWDTAFKESKMNDPSCCTVWGISPGGYYLLYVLNKRMGFPTLLQEVIKQYERGKTYGLGAVPVLIEDRASGQSLIQELGKHSRIPIIKISPENNKMTRLSEVSAIIEAGKVYVPDKAPWKDMTINQLAQFPYGKNDDIVDSVSQFLRYADKPKFKPSGAKFWK
jgi:predicted phage terminase large subunit-like protein